MAHPVPAAAAPPPVVRRYAAFLSYRHADNREEGRRWAEWLHQALETYEVPRDLVGTTNLRGAAVPAALYPVFRDEEELSADADLSQNIRRALDNTEVLIVLCSPRACASTFVAEEIRYFKELGKGDRILALIIDGEPNADDPAKAAHGITPEMECFPQPLRFGVAQPPAAAEQDEGGATDAESGSQKSALPSIDWTQRTEPLAADVRPQNRAGQGYTSAAAYRTALEKERAHSAAEIRRLEKAFAEQLDLARLKIVAGALGVPLGQLRERDAVYQAKKLRRIIAVLGSLTLLALIAAGVAVWQRSQAEKQKNRAVASRQAADDLISFMQYDLRDTLEKLGHLDMMEGINTRIQSYYKEHPLEEDADPAAQEKAERKRAMALEQQGDIQLAQGKLAEALAAYQETLALREPLAQRAPAAVDLQRDLGVSLQNVGKVLKQQGKLDDALSAFRKGAAIFERLARQDESRVDWQRDVAVSQARIGDLLLTQGNFGDALQSYRQALAIDERLARLAPDDAKQQRGLSISLGKIGDALRAQNKFDEALPVYRESAAVAETLARRDAKNADWQYDLAFCLDKVGDALLLLGKNDEALPVYRQSEAIQARLARLDAGNAVWQRGYAGSLEKVGDALKAQRQFDAALASYREARGIREKVAAQDPSSTDRQREVCINAEKTGDVLLAQGQLAEALAIYRESMAITERLLAQSAQNIFLRRGLLLVYLKSAVILLNLPGADRAEAREVVAKGFSLLEALEKTEPASATLQQMRATFEKLRTQIGE